MKRRFGLNSQGSILILTLWTMIFLSILAAQLGLRVRQRATILSRLENKSRLYDMADAGVKKAISSLRMDFQQNPQLLSSSSKMSRHNNPEGFSHKEMKDGFFDVKYQLYDSASNPSEVRYGVVDEESKININTIDKTVLKNIIQQQAKLDDDGSQKLTDAIVEWRAFGKNELVGFESDEYYSNLSDPYEPKDSFFELIEELFLVRGVKPNYRMSLLPFLTVYGDGRININTATRQVLVALGVADSLADKILFVRRGRDGVDATFDDYTFQNPYDIASELKNFVELDPQEIKQIDFLNAMKILKTNSFFYAIKSEARLDNRKEVVSIVCVYNIKDNRIEYWNEK